ncbi:MAG: tRNA (adenosine(37)-N6)-threonylcarbamoyltransferase complex dimerization subunit type 1 TsaB [Bryobacterales bacterium]|nr:tRNA (adenosine(37)-N6)-threonylcarbamoyltransferase complex dimerization subunit type 1 TsaB [Bryobacteraceae bacterium]MDW8131346.1 tRNA (adenosine(37)-N6)-threonylcarbamoyltransferase complex dimerization subunit type 1 TsaB [Bryobacterales bacterium]
MSPRILALDTTAEFGSLALAQAEQIVEETLLHSPDGFAHVLFDHLGRLLARHGWRLDDVDCIAAAAGPGAFTGVRVGLAAAKGLAEAIGRPLVAVSNLQALAWFGSAPLRAAVLDARRGEIYGAVYGAKLELRAPEVVMKFPAWLETLPEGEIEFLSTDFSAFRHALAGTRWASAPVREVPRALAGAIARIALERYRAGQVQDPAAVDALYVRRSDAELAWRE